MNKKTLSLSLLSILLLVASAPMTSAHPPNSTDPAHLKIDTAEMSRTTDPAWAYDRIDRGWIQNVYETLIFFDRDYTLGPYRTGKIDSFVPKLATSCTIQKISEISLEGLVWYWRHTFEIRMGVKWHNPLYGNLTPSDVEYSFERVMVQDRTGGPSWLIYQPLLNVSEAVPPEVDPFWGLKIDHSVESNATHVWFNLANSDVSPDQFMRILCHTVASAVNRVWCQERGDLDVESVPGGWSNWTYIWDAWHNPTLSFIELDMMGTGPYKFDYVIPPLLPPYYFEWSIVRFVDYWGGWPARISDNPSSPLYYTRLMSYVSRVTWYYYPEWATRRTRFLVGDSDQTVVPKEKAIIDDLLRSPGIRCFYPLELLAAEVMLYNFKIATTSPYMGVPGGLPPGTIDETGIPPDFFSDPDVRKALAHSFDYDTYIKEAYQDHAIQPACPVPRSLYYDPTDPQYNYDLALARAHFQVAWEGQVWANGFTFAIAFPSGDAAKQLIAEQLERDIESQNPKFHVDTLGVAWSTYLQNIMNRELPLYPTYVSVDNKHADAYYFFFNFMHSQGYAPAWQHYSNPAMDTAVEAQDYDSAQDTYYTDAPSVPLAEPVGRHWERDWMRGWYYNPLYPGEYAYHRWKAVTHFGDATNGGTVDIVDKGFVSAHWYPGPPVGPLGFSPNADINGGTGGIVCGISGFVAGIPDGKVDIIDAALVSAYWDEAPRGPSHP